MPDYSAECYGGRFMKAADISKPFNGVVERAERAEVEKGKAKVVVYFEGHAKGVVCNATRYNFICELAKSKDTDDWPGLAIGVRRGRTNFGGKMVDCIEFGTPTKKAKTTAEALDDAITF